MTAENASQEGSEPTEPEGAAPTSGPAEPEGTAIAPDADGQYDLKRQFREALARKRGTQADAGAHGSDSATSKVRGAHGPASSQKSFRRKSGG
ncbi:DUF5302 domain-containing protein [Streptomyces sp. NBC_00083]|uniref:DUF5302 domain-containing protein n=1 Tax=Streptomyces sp. NBC_00083 TaxID=2975647 RepID=UPI00224DA4E9|nr:DUF5302 domain-containing protein [Streptomyces sp. NBC_00083]MCX5387328.1 DUF5302 domain-containing protein [Streptomyces sp. NBC_00083]